MTQYNVAQAKARFSEMIRKAAAGQDVVIAKDNKPIVRLVPIREGVGKRSPGSGKGEILSIAKDFDDLPPGFEAYKP